MNDRLSDSRGLEGSVYRQCEIVGLHWPATLKLTQGEKSDKMSLAGFTRTTNPRDKTSREPSAHRKEENNGQNS